MNQFIEFITMAKIGLFLNVIGTIMVALSFGKNPEDANQKNKNGKTVYLSSFTHPLIFKIGLLIICLGFILQMF